jgi:hypothetical protein
VQIVSSPTNRCIERKLGTLAMGFLLVLWILGWGQQGRVWATWGLEPTLCSSFTTTLPASARDALFAALLCQHRESQDCQLCARCPRASRQWASRQLTSCLPAQEVPIFKVKASKLGCRLWGGHRHLRQQEPTAGGAQTGRSGERQVDHEHWGTLRWPAVPSLLRLTLPCPSFSLRHL